MLKSVIKKDGTKAPFDPEKIKRAIAAAATQANLPPEEISRVVAQVSILVMDSLGGAEEATSTEIREKILSELDIRFPAVSAAWRKYDESK